MSINTNCANPLFLKFLDEFYNEARRVGSNAKYTYKKAHDSLAKYPHPLTAKETVKINGIGPNIASRLERRLEEYKKEQNGDSDEAEVIDFTESYQPEIITKSTKEKEAPKKKKQKTKKDKDLAKDNKLYALLPKEIHIEKEEIEKQKIRNKEYVPAYKSGGYAILIALLTLHGNKQNLNIRFTKEQVINLANKHCNIPMDKPLRGTNYTGWSSLKQLVKFDLIHVIQRPFSCSLTEVGYELANRLLLVNNNMDFDDVNINDDDIIVRNVKDRERNNLGDGNTLNNLGNNNTNNSLYDNQNHDIVNTVIENCATSINKIQNEIIINNQNKGSASEFSLKYEDYEIVLIIDNRERADSRDRDYFEIGLTKRGIKVEKRVLNLGDFLWIAKPKSGCLGPEEEIVLDYVVERKRDDDLFASVKDGRFKEQKSRLKSSGVNNVFYLIERLNLLNTESFTISYKQILSNLTSTILNDGFMIKLTKDSEDSLDYLARLTKKIEIIYKDKDLFGINLDLDQKFNFDYKEMGLSFSSYNQMNSIKANFTVQHLFIKMLLAIKGCTLKKVLYIIQKYPTPYSLIKEYKTNEESKNELLLVNNDINSKISAQLSKKIYAFFKC